MISIPNTETRPTLLFPMHDPSHFRGAWILLSEVPNTVELGETGRTDEQVDGCEGVVDGGDDEGVSDLRGRQEGLARIVGGRQGGAG